MAAGRLFDYDRPLAAYLAEKQEMLKAEINSEGEDYFTGVNQEAWVAYLVARHRIDPPFLESDEPLLEDLGERDVDATGMPGVSFSPSEWGQTITRPGRRWKLTIPIGGAAGLTRHGPASGAPVVECDLQDATATHWWDWPVERGSDDLVAEVQSVFGRVRDGTAKVAAQIDKFNEQLPGFVRDVIAERRRALSVQREFLDSMPIPIKHRDDAPESFSLPPITKRSSPAQHLMPAKPEAISGPALGEAYEHILGVIRSMGRAMERTPEDFAGREEERLRDYMLVILNTHYQGQAFAEAFNKTGKTDVLIRVDDLSVFIAECKWWSGPKSFDRAFDQLLGYSTWRDSRLALVFFVKERDFTAIVTKAQAAMCARPEFIGWEPAGDDEMRCRIRWPDDPERRATLTTMLFHLPLPASAKRRSPA